MRLYRLILCLCLILGVSTHAQANVVTDASGIQHTIPEKVDKVICSGPGCLRLLTYLQAEDLIVGVDSIETRHNNFDARPYALANPQFKKYQVFGEFRGHDSPEKILSLNPSPQVIFKTYSEMGYDPVELQKKTGIEVITLQYGNLSTLREDTYNSLRIMGKVVHKEKRAEEIITFFEEQIKELSERCATVPTDQVPLVFLGGVAHKGPHGFQSTEPAYPPFQYIKVNNPSAVNAVTKKALSHSVVSKESILDWDPDVLFLDLSTLLLGENGSGLYELKTDPAYAQLQAVKHNRVYGVLPYNLYTSNHGSTIANSYFIGKVLYPEQFSDIDPVAKADEIYTFLVGQPLFATMDSLFSNMVFKQVEVR